MFNTRRLVFRHTRDLQVVLREGTASVLRAWAFCQNGPVLDGTEALSAASQLPERTVGGAGWTWAAPQGSCDLWACHQSVPPAVLERLPLAPTRGPVFTRSTSI